MQRRSKKTPTFAAPLVLPLVLAIGASFAPAHANDLSVPQYNWSQRTPLDNSLDPNELAIRTLEMEEIDVWGRIRKGFSIPDLDNPLVTTQTTWYSTRPDYIQRTTIRASRYLYHVVQEAQYADRAGALAFH